MSIAPRNRKILHFTSQFSRNNISRFHLLSVRSTSAHPVTRAQWFLWMWWMLFLAIFKSVEHGRVRKRSPKSTRHVDVDRLTHTRGFPVMSTTFHSRSPWRASFSKCSRPWPLTSLTSRVDYVTATMKGGQEINWTHVVQTCREPRRGRKSFHAQPLHASVTISI